MNLTGIHIGLSRVAGCIDEKLGLVCPKRCSQCLETTVVNVRTTQAVERDLVALEV